MAEGTYEPFGKTTVTGAPGNNVSQFTGRDNDGTGLYYYRARYYSPTLHRFLSADPIGFHGGDVNLYSYVGNSPLNFRDPQGTDLVGVTGGVAGGGAVGGLGIVGTASYMVGINTTFVSTPWVGFEIDKSGPIYIVSITVGKGWGAGIFHLETNTPKWSTWEVCNHPPIVPNAPIMR